MEYVGWGLFVLSVIWYFKSMNFSHRKRLHQNYFITYLLLNDEIREVQKRGFQDWILASNAGDANTLASGAFAAIERLADQLALSPDKPGASSAFGATAMIWEYKHRGEANPG